MIEGVVSNTEPSERSAMIANVKARYSNGVFTPLEPLDLEEGKEVVLVIEETSQIAGPGVNVLEDMSSLAKHLIEKYPHDGRDRPTDGSLNYKHYLYNHPKKDQ